MDDDMSSEEVNQQNQEKIDYRNLILQHLSRMSALTTFIPDLRLQTPQGYRPIPIEEIIKVGRSVQGNSLKISADFMSSIFPYKDAKYKEEFKLLLAKQKDIDENEFSLEKIRLLCELLNRRGLLLHNEREAVI